MPKKIQVSFGDAALKIISRLQNASGASSTAEVLRDALSLYDWACEQIEQGYSVGAFKAGSPVKEVVVFRQAARRPAAAAESGNDQQRAADQRAAAI